MVTPVLLVVAILAVVGGVVAVAAPDPRYATLGAFGAVLLAVLIADPMPSAAGLAARIAGAALGGWLVRTALRGAPRVTAHASIGWAGAAGIAAAAVAIGWLAAAAFGATVAVGVGDGQVAGVPGATLAGGSIISRAAIAAAAAVTALAAAPVLLPRDGHRLGLGIVLLFAAASLVCDALGAAPDDTLELAIGILAAILGAAVAGVTSTLLRTGGDLVLRDGIAREPAVRHRVADDAHREGGLVTPLGTEPRVRP